MAKAKNILFVMYDQLRFDYLSCAGHPTLKTPNFDRVAAKGVRFTNAYVQSPVCGPSRMSFYTGRYVHSHGAAGNFYPLKVGEMTMGDHLRKLGVDCWLVGKTHMVLDSEGMQRLGLTRDTPIGARVAECGFDVWVRDDGIVAEGPLGRFKAFPSAYNDYLADRGYTAENPWHENANAGIEGDGSIASGWLLKNSRKPANIEEPDSETPWLTSEAIRFLDATHDTPWVCHVSYIKPHWPYIAPSPYNDMYGPEDVVPVVRSEDERVDPQPVYGAFMDNMIGTTFSKDGVREEVIPAYMGLIAQCDAELGRLLDHLDATGRADDTMIVLCSDHGDYMGDHWMGEKDLFHDCSAKVPMIVYDPSPEADATRGTTCGALVEAIDLAPTFVEAMGGEVPGHILEGRSLLPWLRGETPDWRDAVFSEYDYTMTTMAADLGKGPKEALLFMVFDGRWKLMHAEGFRPMLFDLETDPQELNDLGADPAHADQVARLMARLNRWARRNAQRTTMTDAALLGARGRAFDAGIYLGVWDENELDARFRPFVTGTATHDYTAPAKKDESA